MLKNDLFLECLLNHLNFEFDNFGAVYESHGYYDKISDIVVNLIRNIRDDILKLNDGERLTKCYRDMSLFGDSKLFFDGFSMTIDIKYSTSEKNNIHGGYDLFNSNMIVYGDNISFCPIIYISGYGDSKRYILGKMYNIIGHEFTHAYNDYMIFKKSGFKKRMRDIYNPVSVNRAAASSNFIESAIGNVMYLTDISEINARIAELKQELEIYNGSFNDSKDVSIAISKTDLYHKVKDVNDIIRILDSNFNDGTIFSDYLKNLFLLDMNDMSGKKFNTFNQAFKYLKERVYELNKRFYEKVSKVAHDVFVDKHSNKIIDFNIDSKDLINRLR
jgi:hypothetical protein